MIEIQVGSFGSMRLELREVGRARITTAGLAPLHIPGENGREREYDLSADLHRAEGGDWHVAGRRERAGHADMTCTVISTRRVAADAIRHVALEAIEQALTEQLTGELLAEVARSERAILQRRLASAQRAADEALAELDAFDRDRSAQG